MAKLMFKEHVGGFHNFPDSEVEAAMKDGWIDGQAIWDAAVKKKSNPVEKVQPVEIPAIIEEQAKRSPGRPRKTY